jgi:hypothetical protein
MSETLWLEFFSRYLQIPTLPDAQSTSGARDELDRHNTFKPPALPNFWANLNYFHMM